MKMKVGYFVGVIPIVLHVIPACTGVWLSGGMERLLDMLSYSYPIMLGSVIACTIVGIIVELFWDD